MINSFSSKLLFTFCFLLLAIVKLYAKCPYFPGWKPKQIKINNQQVLTQTKYGFWMVVDDNDSYGSVLTRKEGLKEPELVYLAMRCLKKGDTVMNIGSQTGMQAVAFARIIGESGKIFVFEPYEVSYKIMRKNLFLNGFGRISKTYKMAGSNKNGVSKILIPGTHTGGTKVNNSKPVAQGQPISGLVQVQGGSEQQVLLVRVEDVIPEDVQFDLLFMDTEGHEMHVLDGMKQIIERSPNMIIIAEWKSLDWYPNRQLFNQTVAYLFQKGYTIYDILPRQSKQVINQCKMPKLNLMEDLKSLTHQEPYSSNVIMLPPGAQLPKY